MEANSSYSELNITNFFPKNRKYNFQNLYNKLREISKKDEPIILIYIKSIWPKKL